MVLFDGSGFMDQGLVGFIALMSFWGYKPCLDTGLRVLV